MTEQDQGILGAEMVVSQLGVYALELQGAGKANAQFQPFTLTYNVTVARGAASSPQTARQDHAQTHSVPSRTKAQQPEQPQPSSQGLATAILVAVSGLGLLGLLVFRLLR